MFRLFITIIFLVSFSRTKCLHRLLITELIYKLDKLAIYKGTALYLSLGTWSR